MIINYTALAIDENKKLKDVLKKRLYISSELLKKLKYSNCIYVNNSNAYTNYIVHFHKIRFLYPILFRKIHQSLKINLN